MSGIRATNACPYCAQDCTFHGDGAYRCTKCNEELIAAVNPTSGQIESVFPANLNGYIISWSAGRGGMGHVFHGQDKVSRKEVAIKFPADSDTWDQETDLRFSREIITLKTIDHPNVVRIHETGIEAGRRYIVMDWVEGEDLSKVLTQCRKEGSSLPFSLVHPLFQQLCQALQALHDRGIVHRDIKPANLILNPDQKLTLIDLGIAKQVDSQDSQSTMATQGTMILGTVEYLAPEQLHSPAQVDHRADIYAAGQVTYELLTGHLPKGNVRWPSEINPTAPKWFDLVLQRMMEQKPNARPQSIGDLAQLNEESVLFPHNDTPNAETISNDPYRPIWWKASFAAGGALMGGFGGSVAGYLIGGLISWLFNAEALGNAIAWVAMGLLSMGGLIVYALLGFESSPSFEPRLWIQQSLWDLRRSGQILGLMVGALGAIAAWFLTLIGSWVALPSGYGLPVTSWLILFLIIVGGGMLLGCLLGTWIRETGLLGAMDHIRRLSLSRKIIFPSVLLVGFVVGMYFANSWGRDAFVSDKATLAWVEYWKRSSTSYSRSGDAHRFIKNYDKAISDYTSAIQLDANADSSYIARGHCYRQ